MYGGGLDRHLQALFAAGLPENCIHSPYHALTRADVDYRMSISGKRTAGRQERHSQYRAAAVAHGERCLHISPRAACRADEHEHHES